MNKEDIIRMAMAAGYQHPEAVGRCEDFAYFDLLHFAALVAAVEREACAKLADDIDPVWESISFAIRARGLE